MTLNGNPADIRLDRNSIPDVFLRGRFYREPSRP